MPVNNEQTPLFQKPNIQDEKEEKETPLIEPTKESPKRTAGLVSSTANLALACIGAGILGFPFAIKATGLVNGIFTAAVLVLIAVSSLHILALGAVKVNASTYQETVLLLLGKYWSIVSELFLIVYHIGACTVYLTVISDTAAPLFAHWFPGKWYSDRRFVVTIFAVFVVFPLICIKRVSLLSYTSGLAVLSSFYTCAFIVVQGVYFIVQNNGPSSSATIFFNPSFQVISAFPIITFAFQCHIMLIPIYAELENPTIWRMDIVIVGALLLCFLLEGTVAIFGYLTFGAATLGNILKNYNIKSIPAGVARLGMGFVAVFAYPMANFTARLTVKSLVFRNSEFTDLKFYITTVLWFIMTLLLALFVPNISVVFGLTGSLGCTAVMFLFPGLILWVLGNDYTPTKKILARIYAVFLIAFGFVVLLGGTVVSILEIVLGAEWFKTTDFWKK